MSTILIVDDDFEWRMLIHRLLQKSGYEVLEAENGKNALKVLENSAIDLVLTDILMPIMDGVELIRELAQRHPGLPVIAMTSNIEMPYLNIAMKLGAMNCLQKPFNRNQLLEMINEALGKINDSIIHE